MTALILDSGRGTRMGDLTASQPKCMTPVGGETILQRQLRLLCQAGVRRIVITTGAHAEALRKHAESLGLPAELVFVHNPDFETTNYIWSMHLAREVLGEGDILLLHGDLVFEETVLEKLLLRDRSSMAVSSTQALPEKDFKAVIREGRISAVGVEFFQDAQAAQPLYLLKKRDRQLWWDRLSQRALSGDRGCYAEKALNEVLDQGELFPMDFGTLLCAEVDTPQDLEAVKARLESLGDRRVYMCFSTDILHSGHMAMIRRGARLGKLTVGVMTDEAVAGYKRYPLMPWSERRAMFEGLRGVEQVVEQRSLSYLENIERLRPDLIVHGDDWDRGFQEPVRRQVLEAVGAYGGWVVEFPYSQDPLYTELERRARAELSSPDLRRDRLRRLLGLKSPVTAIEAHSGLTGLIAENTVVWEKGAARQFDAMWVSSLCDSTARGKPDIELVDLTSRLRTVDEIMEVTTKPIIFDGDTGGLTEHFVYTVRTLERMGVSMVIIEDKVGLKRNSLFGQEAGQSQAEIEEFCQKLRAGKKAQKTQGFMICARIESLILGKGQEDALERARAYVEAGADAVMIHSCSADPGEVLGFADAFRREDSTTPLVAVPTSYSGVTEEELGAHGIGLVIYANQLTRSAVPAMEQAARDILTHHRARECDGHCMSFKDIIRLIPEG